jgi:phosphatidylserine/phosphatidylglycerophosphate/cardiolipin synthase-like enzyme
MRFKSLAAVLLSLGLGLTACGAPATSARPGAALKAVSGVRAKSANGQLEIFRQPDAGATPLIALIDGAKKSIDFKIYMMSMSGPAAEVVMALQKAQRRGVAVRVAIEAFPYMPQGNPTPGGPNAKAVNELLKAGVNVMYTRPNFKYTHEKSLVIDGDTTVIMTMNITRSSFTTNREFGIINRRPNDVLFVSRLFQADWVGDQPLVPINPAMVVSPYNSRHQMYNLVAAAQKSLIVESNSLNDPALVAMAGTRAKAGVDVKVLIPANRDGSVDPKAYKRLADAGVKEIRFLPAPYLHAKVIIADNSRAYVGSENLTANSLDNNRELGMLLDDQTIVGSLLATNAEDWAKGKTFNDQPPPPPPATGSVPPAPPSTGSQPISPLDWDWADWE